MTLTFYRAFEDRYRGSRETITTRLRAYAPFVQPLAAPGAAALDLGCGRGEWLELLEEYGFAARGIDLDDGMLTACRERGLQVETMDALAALRAAPDASLALVSAFHLVEHIDFDLVRELVHEALRALRPGGLLIMETPNPENLVVGASSFYMDPSHLKPIPPNLLAFTAEYAGYRRHKVVRLQEDPQLHSDPQLGLVNVLEGPSPDYSVVAQKDGGAAVLAPLDAAFGAEYGIAMAPLAARYEEQHQQQIKELHLHHQALATLQREQHVQLHEQLHGQLLPQTRALQDGAAAQQRQLDEMRALAARQAQILGDTGHRIWQLEQRVDAAEARADAMGQRVVDLLSSSSWRLTAPLRAASTLAQRVRGGARRRLRALLLRGAQAVLRMPRAKRAARAVLRHVPGLQARLYRLLVQASSAAPAAALNDTVDAAGQLSPRAARIFHELKKVQQKEQQTRNR
jgi:O-antigen chain-terminating methyltransferase